MKISSKHFLLGLFIGLGLLVGILYYWPDRKLHIVFCDVGQGDAIYIRMPGGTDLLVDGGPNDRVLSCLGKYMPFYDRTIDLVALTHPQKDHLQGLISVLERYKVKYFISTPVGNSTAGYQKLITSIKKQNIPVKYLTTGDRINFDQVTIFTLWPEKNWLINQLNLSQEEAVRLDETRSGDVLSAITADVNVFSFYFQIQMGDFDLLLTGDGDERTQMEMMRLGLDQLIPDRVEVFKIPHHGSRAAFTEEFINKISPQLAVIQVGKNSYGHPNEQVVEDLDKWGKVLRTDLSGDIEVVSDGNKWRVIN